MNQMYKMFLLVINIIVIWAASFTSSHSQTIVKTLPGYPGPLPFTLETGYIGVGEDEAVQLFYSFVESEGNPEDDPLIIWLAGGPGCSNLHAFFFEIGPLKIRNKIGIDDVPELYMDPNSWAKVANIIYLDGPTLTGYSYTTTPEAAYSSDTSSASQTTEFIRKFVRDHPRFLKNPMYVTGISYSGIVIPMITEMIYKGNEQGLEPIINIKGYIAGNPLTDKSGDINSRFEYAYRMGLISKDLFESTRKYCNGEYAEANNKNMLCISRIGDVNKERVIEKSLCNIDMNYKAGDTSLPLYEFDVQSSLVYHQKLSKRKCRALIFSGDHDMTVPYIGTYNWIESLNLTITESNWDAWYSNGQVAGFKTTYAHNNYSLVFATVKGGSHTVPQDKPKQCLDMVQRWFADRPI